MAKSSFVAEVTFNPIFIVELLCCILYLINHFIIYSQRKQTISLRDKFNSTWSR